MYLNTNYVTRFVVGTKEVVLSKENIILVIKNTEPGGKDNEKAIQNKVGRILQ